MNSLTDVPLRRPIYSVLARGFVFSLSPTVMKSLLIGTLLSFSAALAQGKQNIIKWSNSSPLLFYTRRHLWQWRNGAECCHQRWRHLQLQDFQEGQVQQQHGLLRLLRAGRVLWGDDALLQQDQHQEQQGLHQRRHATHHQWRGRKNVGTPL